MKNIKKALIGTTLAGVLIAGAGAGTYSWFNASYQASGEITNHTLTINDELNAKETLDFGNEKLAPSRTVSDSFSIRNSGTMDQVLRLNADLALYDGSTNVSVPDKSEYEATATVFVNGNKIGSKTGNIQSIDDYLESKPWHPNADGVGDFPSGTEVEVDLDVKLLETAGNKYQGKTLKGKITVEARQTDEGSQFSSETSEDDVPVVE